MKQEHDGQMAATDDGSLHEDPICGMSVKADTPHRVTRGDETHFFCGAGCAEKFRRTLAAHAGHPTPKGPAREADKTLEASAVHLPDAPRDPERPPGRLPEMRHGTRKGGAGRRGGQDGMDLPHAPADRARRTGHLPDLRHGAGAEDRFARGRRKPGARGHDPTVLGQRGPDRPSLCDGDGAPDSRPAAWATSCRPRSWAGSSYSWQHPSCSGAPGRSSSGRGARS